MKNLDYENPELQEELAEKLEKVQWHGHYYTACCPFHEETHPSFFVYPDGFRCSSCGEWGSLDKLEKKLSGVVEVIHDFNYEYAPFKAWERIYGSWENAAISAYRTAKSFPALLSYIKERKLDKYVSIGKFGWLDGWFSFPVFDDSGDMVDWVVRSHPKKEIGLRYVTRPRQGNGDNHLYCPDWGRVNSSDVVYVPFGLLDVWSVYACGLPAITGITGQEIKPELFDNIRKKIIIIPDAGEIAGARKLQQALGWRGELKVIDYPNETKDANGIHMKYGIEKLKSLILS